MRAILDQPVFSVGDAVIRWEDVVLAAARSGTWDEVVRRARVGLELVAKAADGDEPTSSDEEIEELSNEFRYDRDLVSADEMEAWLSRWGLDVGTWYAWLQADLLRRKREGEGEAVEPEGSALSPEEIEAAVHAEAVCSRALTRLAYDLAAKAAVAARAKEEGGDATLVDDVEAVEAARGVDPATPGLRLSIDPSRLPERLAALQTLDRDWRRFVRAVVTPPDVAARIRAHQADWMRVDIRYAELPREDVAREALMSIREDGCDLEEAAESAGAGVVEGRYFLEDFEPSVHDHLLAAQKGEVIGPLKFGDGFGLFLVVEKILPTADDPVIADRAKESLLESVVSREVDNRVTWQWRP